MNDTTSCNRPKNAITKNGWTKLYFQGIAGDGSTQPLIVTLKPNVHVTNDYLSRFNLAAVEHSEKTFGLAQLAIMPVCEMDVYEQSLNEIALSAYSRLH